MSFYIVKGDLLKQKVDAIVIPSAPHLRPEGTIGDKVKKLCGEKLQHELEQLKNINIGECVITNAYNLECKKIIHVANPKWNGGNDNEEENLRFSYIACLDKALDFGLESIAFPLLSAGAYAFPKRKAINIAIKTIKEYIEDNQMDVCLVIYDYDTYKNYKEIFGQNSVIEGHLSRDSKEQLEVMKRERGGFSWYKKGLTQLLDNGPETKNFREKLNYFMSQKGLTKQDCYLGVISKTMFNNILNGAVPKKYTVVSLGINMGLNIYEIDELLSTIDERLDPMIEKDQIIRSNLFCDKDIDDINKELVATGHPPLKIN